MGSYRYWQSFKESSPAIPPGAEGTWLPEPSPPRTTRTRERMLLPGSGAIVHQESASCTNPRLPTFVPIRHLIIILTFKDIFHKKFLKVCLISMSCIPAATLPFLTMFPGKVQHHFPLPAPDLPPQHSPACWPQSTQVPNTNEQPWAEGRPTRMMFGSWPWDLSSRTLAFLLCEMGL